MRRRRWAPLAAACLVALAVLLAAVHGRGLPGASVPMPAARRSGASVRARGRVAAFDASSVARCRKQGNGAGPACAGLLGGGGDDDDERVVPTGSNPLHNR